MKKYFYFLNTIHIFNDGYKAAFLLLLPFIAKDFHLSLTSVGFLAFLVNCTTTVLAIPTGYLSGKFGGIKILVFSLLIYALGFIFTGFVKTPYFLPVTFFLTGIGFGAFHTISFALVAKYTNTQERGRKMGEFSAAGELGRVGITAAITFIAGFISWQLTSIAFGIVACILWATTHLANLGSLETTVVKSAASENVSGFKHMLQDAQFILANLTGVFDCFASGSLYIFIPFLLIARHVPLYWLGVFTSIFFVGAIVSKFFIGPLIDKFGNEKVFVLSEIGMAIFILCLTNIPSLIGIAISAVVLGAFTKGTSPITQTMVARTLEKHKNFEKGFALNNFSVSTANFLAPVVLGFLADRFGIFTAFNISAFFALVAIIPAIGLRWLVKRNKEENLLFAMSE